MNNNILIDATGGDFWIGGLYYKKNIIYSLLSNNWIKDRYNFIVVTDSNNVDMFKAFGDKISVKIISYKNIQHKKIKIMLLAKKSHCRYIFPSIGEKACRIINTIGINWIPDFQHLYYPLNFSQKIIDSRNESFMNYYKSTFPLVLSSNDSKSDFEKFYGHNKKNVYVVPFVSYIENEINFSEEYIDSVCDKYKIKKSCYVLVANQFWKHKNHIVVLRAIERLLKNDDWNKNIKFVFTGKLDDSLKDDYSNDIREILGQDSIANIVECLGFIDRKEQLAIMKRANIVIQPSLFEGWGTVLEDAKVLDKRIILSDIPIHREQMNDNCILFNPHDPDQLVDILINSIDDPYEDNTAKGIEDMRIRAELYSQEFERLLKEN